jgi:hypothetical protein
MDFLLEPEKESFFLNVFGTQHEMHQEGGSSRLVLCRIAV